MPKIHFNKINTPAFVYSADEIVRNCRMIEKICINVNASILYSLKPLSLYGVLKTINKYVDGFSVSSAFEARLADEILLNQEIHFVSPGVKSNEINTLAKTCDKVIFNSIEQFKAYINTASACSVGIRVNPKHSFVNDERYNPTRRYSKLGVSVNSMLELFKEDAKIFRKLSGIHFHNNCESVAFKSLYETVQYLDTALEEALERLEWINLGGGYLFPPDADYEYLEMAVSLLREKYGLDVYMEPGKAFVKDAGYLVSSVIDLFESDGKQIAVLDTTVNHAPEVFEYQYSPDVIGHTDSGEYEYILAGCSCLAGDLFGEYRFNEPLEIGSRVIFTDMAAYSLVKANMFNGINLPSIYKYSEDGSIELIKEYTYQDYRSRLGEITSETSRERNINTSNQESSKVISLSRG